MYCSSIEKGEKIWIVSSQFNYLNIVILYLFLKYPLFLNIFTVSGDVDTYLFVGLYPSIHCHIPSVRNGEGLCQEVQWHPSCVLITPYVLRLQICFSSMDFLLHFPTNYLRSWLSQWLFVLRAVGLIAVRNKYYCGL